MIELVFILDRSGSMSGLKQDTITSFNNIIQKQKKEKGEVLISTVLFNDETRIIHDRISIDKVKKLTQEDYYVYGCTALLDAVGGAIHHIGNIHKYARKEDRPEKTLFVITTDGMENASKRYTYDQVYHMVQRQKEKYSWDFIFLGANIDAAKEARAFGIDASMACDYHADSKGTQVNYKAINNAISSLRTSKRIDPKWRDKIDKDYKSRQ